MLADGHVIPRIALQWLGRHGANEDVILVWRNAALIATASLSTLRDTGQNMCSLFQLKHEATYSQHPNLVQYFLPYTDAEFQERLEQHKGEIAIMLRSSEFNQDKTALIVTNNPLPLFISGQQLSTPFQFFPEDIKRRKQPGSDHLPPLKAPKSQLGPSSRKARKPAEFRFSRDKDFTSEAHFSKNYAERRLLRMYPHLRTHMKSGANELEPLPSIQGWSPQRTQWEPLTISCLTETRHTIPVPGEDGFRYGRAPLWIVDNSVVSKNTK